MNDENFSKLPRREREVFAGLIDDIADLYSELETEVNGAIVQAASASIPAFPEQQLLSLVKDRLSVAVAMVKDAKK